MASNHMLIIKQINPKRVFVNLRVKLLSMETMSNINFDQGPEFRDLIVSDEEGDRIGVPIKNFYKPKYEALLKIQHNYNIRNAFVGTNPFKGRMTHYNHESKLNINHKTSVLPLPESEWNGENGFKFILFDEILDENKTVEHVTADVIGRVSNYSLEKQYRDGDDLQSKYIVIELKDLNDNLLSCTLWGTFIREFQKRLKEASDQDCVILIVQFGRTKKHCDMIVRSDWNFTQVSLNADVEPDSQTSLAPTLTPPGKQVDGWFNQVTCVGCNELPICGPGLHAIQAQIIVVLPDDEWSYIGCRKCHRIAKLTKPVVDLTLDIDALMLVKRRCNSARCHDNPQVCVRYKVNVRVEDTTDESNRTESLTLFETQVEVSEYNLKQSNPIFTVKDASEDEAFVEKFVEEYKKEKTNNSAKLKLLDDLIESSSTKCGSSNGSDDTPTVDLSNTIEYTPPKKVVKQEGRESPLSVKSTTSMVQKNLNP
ncbi:uncharacterized protein [Rutidosis leptorrhynchoides]|uniref:uncharacterized protein n=1 Tax=Rutidosis leptorrhynchoides TaxID=125765 RepID=UPI003A98E12E